MGTTAGHHLGYTFNGPFHGGKFGEEIIIQLFFSIIISRSAGQPICLLDLEARQFQDELPASHGVLHRLSDVSLHDLSGSAAQQSQDETGRKSPQYVSSESFIYITLDYTTLH